MGRVGYDTWRQLSLGLYETIGSTSLSRYLFVPTGKATLANGGTRASRWGRYSSDRQQGRRSATSKLLGGSPENWRLPEINTVPELSERRGEHPPGVRKEAADKGGSLVRGSLPWEPLRRNSSSRFTSGYGG
jgi:hypothetical protein